MTTANDLYSLTPKRVSRDLYRVLRHTPEIDNTGIPDDLYDDNPRVENRILEHEDFDYRRYWHLSTVWFDNKPVMIVQNAGREGSDHSARFITHPENYIDMVSYLLSITNRDEYDSVDPDQDIPELTRFYNCVFTSAGE